MGAYDDILNPKQEKAGTYDDILNAPETGIGDDIRNAAGGFARSGMGVVSNLMRPLDYVTGGSHDERMARVADRFGRQGYNQDSLSFKGGKLAGDVAVTAPVGGFMAKGVQAIKPLANAIPNLAPALQSGGFRVAQKATTLPGKLANAAVRTGAGAAVGGASAGLIDMKDAGTGAVIGAAMPGAVKVAGEAVKLVNKGAKTVLTQALGASTGTGADAIRTAYSAGKTGSTEFLDNMRGNTSFDDVVAKAKDALGNMRQTRAADYRSGMAAVSGDKTVIDFKPIVNAMGKVSSMGSYKGQQINKNAAGTVQELADTVNHWAGLNPAEYHTPEGLDALKQAIGDIRDATQFGTPARRAADSVYNSVKSEITAQAPTYSKVMKDYSAASETLSEIEKALSLGNKASKDTAVRKLQSLLRNNVATNYGNRLNLAQTLEKQGSASLLPAIAGQSMNSAMPRGLAGAIEKGGAGLLAIGSGGASIPMTLAAAPFTSPRVMGEALYGAGRASGVTQEMLKNITPAMLQSGLLNPAIRDSALAVGRTIPLAISANR